VTEERKNKNSSVMLVRIDSRLARALKVMAARTGTTIREIVERAVTQFLAAGGGR
jgi:predicted HicB family RNase H-like nuclease